MNDTGQSAPAVWLEWICRWMATTGALILAALALMTVASVCGRFLFGQPIHGDFEMVEVGCAIAVSLFLPYCQLRNGNVIVDFVTMRAPPAVKQVLDTLGCLILAGAAAVLSWRLSLGGYDLYRYNDQTMVLEIPTWIAFVVLVPSFGLLAITGVVTAIRAWHGQLETDSGH